MVLHSPDQNIRCLAADKAGKKLCMNISHTLLFLTPGIETQIFMFHIASALKYQE
jgi:hypothetical protein